MKNLITLILAVIFITSSQSLKAQVVITNDTFFNTAHQMFLANELFESGEPFAEELGYNLDDLDPMILNLPDSTSYTTGVEGYEYSRYLLNTLNGRSGLGLHVMWSPIITANAAMQSDSFDGMFTGGVPNNFKEDDMTMMMIRNFGMNANQQPPANAFPQFADFSSGMSTLPQTVAANFGMDFSSTRWDRSKMDKTLNLGAMGQSMWKQYYWAQDMLGSFHDGNEDDVEPTGTNSPDLPGSPMFDPDNDIYYGGNNLDGFIGQVLTAVSINKTALLINKLAYDGSQLGAVNPATYNPANGIQYFPTRIAVTESMVLPNLPPRASAFEVTDETSQLFDQLSFLVASSNYRNMMNPNDNSDAAHLAYHKVFDGFPFPADAATTGTPGPFDLMSGASKVIFLNLMAMHFNSTEGSFVNESHLDANGLPVMSASITAENAGYILVALAKFSEEFEGTPLKMMADNAITAQANFILSKFADTQGGFFNGYDFATGSASTPKTLSANGALIRGLYSAYNATANSDYLDAANSGYNFLINNFYRPSKMAFLTEMNENLASYNPWNLAVLSGALRSASLTGEMSEASNIYTRVFKKIYNKMILSEAEATGETGGDSDGDGIPYIAGGTKPFVFAAGAEMDLTVSGVGTINRGISRMTLWPNPTADYVDVTMKMDKPAMVEVNIYSVAGKLISSNFTNLLSEGSQRISIPLDVVAGNYFVRASINNELVAIEKLIVR